jgi:chromosome condensin MukBEF complex kleisin-like MukF subunit
MKKSEDWNYSISRIKHYGFYLFRPTAERVPNTRIWPVLPLGWQISDYAMTRMRLSVLRDSVTINKVLERFGTAEKVKR